MLQSTAQLEFWTTEKNIEFFPFLNEASKIVKDLVDEENKLDEKEKPQVKLMIYWLTLKLKQTH